MFFYLRAYAPLTIVLSLLGYFSYVPPQVYSILDALRRYSNNGRTDALTAFRVAYCSLGDVVGDSTCPFVELGKDVRNIQIKLNEVCDQSDPLGLGYICNTTLSPDCSILCEDQQRLQHYIDAILDVNPFRGIAGELLEPWLVPQTDLAQNGAYIFMSQRQALYVYWRTLALKRLFPNSTVVSNETNRLLNGQNATIVNALEYGLTYGCNWDAAHFSRDPEACMPPRGMWSGVGYSGMQGNIFSLMAWTSQVAIENAVGFCGSPQRSHADMTGPLIWCPHDSIVGAVRGGKSGPDARQVLDNAGFWRSRRDLKETGVYPNVCHFEGSSWLWQNEVDSAEEKQKYCRGAATVPDAYGEDVADFMSRDRPGSLTVDIAGAQYGGGCGSASGQTYSTQDESLPVFYPETVALSFNSRNRSITTGSTSLIFFGVRRYFSGQSGSHGFDYDGLQRPLFNHGSPCGDLKFARIMSSSQVLNATVLTSIGVDRSDGMRVKMYKHSLGVFTSSCGTCADGNLPTTESKYKTKGPTCLVQWSHGRSGCAQVENTSSDWTYWMDVWIWVGALWPRFYPAATRQVFRDIVQRIGTGPWGAGVWWGNTLQYFVVTWLATALLWDRVGAGPQLDYYAYGVAGQSGPPLGGFCEQYQAQGYEDVVRRLPQIQAAVVTRLSREPVALRDLFGWLRDCSRCTSNCSFPGVGPAPADVYCTSPCTDDFFSCFVHAINSTRNVSEQSQQVMW